MKNIKIYDITLMAISLAILVICSKISIPIGAIPLTLQTFSVFLIALILGVKKSVIVFIIYIIMGLLGIPVFSSGGGFHYIFMPSFGFIIGFLAAAPIIGIASKSDKFYLKYITSFIGLLIINIFGVLYMLIILNYYNGLNKDIIYVLGVAVAPFIIKDIFVVILTCIIYSRLQLVIYKREKKVSLFEQEKIQH